MKPRVGQPADRWTPARKKRHSRIASRNWDKLSPIDRLRRSSRKLLSKQPMDDAEYDELEFELVVSLFFKNIEKMIGWRVDQFRALAQGTEIDEERLFSLRAKFILKYTELGDNDDE